MDPETFWGVDSPDLIEQIEQEARTAPEWATWLRDGCQVLPEWDDEVHDPPIITEEEWAKMTWRAIEHEKRVRQAEEEASRKESDGSTHS
ncbi:MAG TPA: hypothetical protein VG013_09245 [Gemmataceae bacterium]|jgi:hypothetical protein|nr:hypothetical protein [Gemmataceae bacterium]